MHTIHFISRRVQLGCVTFDLYPSRESLDPALPFGQNTFPLEHYLDEAGLKLTFPVAIVHTLQVDNKRHRRKGYGTRLLQEFESQAGNRGCRLAILKVGWNNKREMEENPPWYQHRGWTLVQPTDKHSIIALKKIHSNVPFRCLADG
jgi:GNAT superfamily N-acetyltransferase